MRYSGAVPCFFVLVLVWFARPEVEHQITVRAGLVATMLATIISASLYFAARRPLGVGFKAGMLD